MELFSKAEACGCNKWNCPLCRTDKLARTTDPVTSHEAARKVQRDTMLANLISVFEKSSGMTAEEAATAAGYTAADGAWKRVSDLINAGVLVDTGQTRAGSSGRQQRVLKVNPQRGQVLKPGVH